MDGRAKLKCEADVRRLLDSLDETQPGMSLYAVTEFARSSYRAQRGRAHYSQDAFVKELHKQLIRRKRNGNDTR